MLTLDSLGVRIFLRAASDAAGAAEAVRVCHDRAKDYSRQRSALWDGWWLLKTEAESCVEELRSRGGLLHFGSPQALEWINTRGHSHE